MRGKAPEPAAGLGVLASGSRSRLITSFSGERSGLSFLTVQFGACKSDSATGAWHRAVTVGPRRFAGGRALLL